MSMGEQLAAAEMHVKSMWEPTGWDSPETAFDLDQDDVDTVIASLAPQRKVMVKVEKTETFAVHTENTNESSHVSNTSLPPSPPSCTDDIADAVHMLSQKNDDLLLINATKDAEIASLENKLEVAVANIKGAELKARDSFLMYVEEREKLKVVCAERDAFKEQLETKDSIISGLQRRNTELSLSNAETIKAKNEESAGHKRTRLALDQVRADLFLAQADLKYEADAKMWEQYVEGGNPIVSPHDDFVLSVEFADKDVARAKGARWDNLLRKWIVPKQGTSLRPFIRWIV